MRYNKLMIVEFNVIISMKILLEEVQEDGRML